MLYVLLFALLAFLLFQTPAFQPSLSVNDCMNTEAHTDSVKPSPCSALKRNMWQEKELYFIRWLNV